VLGFINPDGEVVVHALTCPRAAVLKASYGPRIVTTKWESVRGKFMAQVNIEGVDRQGILQELIQMISTVLSLDIRKLNIEATNEVFACKLYVRVDDTGVVDDLCQKVMKINGVKSATRI
jgi:GTP pyrophosphokinase